VEHERLPTPSMSDPLESTTEPLGRGHEFDDGRHPLGTPNF
jgi:hypothetical protein